MKWIHPFLLYALTVIGWTCTQCESSKTPTMKQPHSNALVNETSPYLLQHAHNPVNWQPWGERALEQAREEDKPMLISIGYSACHWCHVMEHESFEDEEVARLMNEHFVCIKVDREERPDVDQVYMDAVQLMTGRGGWPLNCFALPDGRPFFGGTYFPKSQWMDVLRKVNDVYQNDRKKVEEYATQLTEGINRMDDLPVVKVPEKFSDEAVEVALAKWKKRMDNQEGGFASPPKFPMPNNYQFLLFQAVAEDDQELMDHVRLTLTKMAFGGIYDQVGGGFARYSTDEVWKVPHFEKMLYDNGQLLSLYAQAYQATGDPLYLEVLTETKTFIQRELTDPSGAFYSALDADSEGEEGKFYVWTIDELKALASNDWSIISEFYALRQRDAWEHGKFILTRTAPTGEVAESLGLDNETVTTAVNRFHARAMEARTHRTRPGLDDKSLTSWNAMTAVGLLDAYMATGDRTFFTLAKDNLEFLLKHQLKEDGSLWHSYKAGTSSIDGYLEDYAHLCTALLRMYESCFDEAYLHHAVELAAYVEANFDRTEAGFFHFSSKHADPLIATKAEVLDNVIPASNSVMATVYFKLSLLTGRSDWRTIAEQMLAVVEPNFSRHPSGHSQWMTLMRFCAEPFHEVAIVGKDCEEKRMEIAMEYLPNAVLCGGKQEGDLTILQNRRVEGKTLLYVCQNGACQLPTESVEQAITQTRM